MWILTPLQSGGETHYLLSSKEYVVGRKNCDILLNNDQSISRAHAHLTVIDQTLTLKDTSKYGTFVNGQRLTENTSVNLKSGDTVTFGVFDSKFSVDHQKPVVCSSCLDSDGKASLSQALLPLGGKLVNTWTEDCTHLIMPSTKVTIKTICALLCCRPIVKPEFFLELSKAAQQKLPPPKAESFLPEIDEPSLSKEDVNLGAMPVRKQLFTGKTFIFLSAKQLKRLSAAVSFGGGKSQLLEEGSLPQDLLESAQSCVIDATASSCHTLLLSSTIEWANAVKNIVERKGLRVIPESEIGLAAIFASCDKHCNPSSPISDSESVPKVTPRIPSASLSQSLAVNETVLPAASQNITAYAVNTEPSQRTELSKVAGLTEVGETPEKKQNQNASHLRGSKSIAQRTTQCVVADTMSSSFHTVENTDTQRKKPESKLTVSGAGSSGMRFQPGTNVGPRTFLQKQSPQKPKNSAQASPQKQSTLTSFFQPVNKKRPLEDELFPVMSEPKRPVLEASISIQAPNTSVTSKETCSRSDRVTSQTPPGSGVDLFGGRSEAQAGRVSNAVQEEARSRKRKEMEAEIEIDELESIMSEDMDCFDEQPSDNQGQRAQLLMHSSTRKKHGSAEASSSGKRQRLQQEENGMHQRPKVGLDKESGSHKNKNHSQKSEQHIVSIKTEPVDPLEYGKTYPESSKRSGVSSTSTSKDIEPFEDDEASFIEDLELLQADICQPKEETKTPLKPVKIKQEVQESKIEEDLPKKLVLVEFRSLTVTAPPKTKPQMMQDISNRKNFKCFRKIHVPGAEGPPHIIAGSDLLVHNRGKNSDLDEWLKDAAEEERQSRRDESVGDDLFRYNPTKLAKRR